ncbi:hypothetical protein A6770_39430 [Nostoc minutum NIES-26]|uniref:S-layer family protein n=1 Tax=Nostoc minutum NIES-26 TaxID=1844469 RepID=A0A367RSN4_9NOSO|nr:hypothetical protein A6770_39430 [Nostoc minutum NIES-26]
MFSATYSGSGNSGNGGAITLKAFDSINITDTFNTEPGSFFSGGLNSSSFSPNSTAKKGGEINLVATNGINITGDLYAYSLSFKGIAGNGGDIRLEAKNGSITTGNLSTNSNSNSGTSGNGGAIAFTAKANITTGGINSQASSAGNGGDINLTSIAGAIDTTKGTITSQISEGSNGTGRAGKIVFTAKNNIQTAELDASAEKGDASSIQLTSTNGEIDTTKGTLYTNSRNGNGGAINLQAADNITTSDLSSYSRSDSGSAGDGGAINLTATDGNIYTNNLYSYSQFNSGIAGNGGAINLRAAKGSIFIDDLYSVSYSDPTLKGNGGNGGAIAFTALGDITTGGINSETFGAGNGGDINLASIAGGIDTTRGTITSKIEENSGINRRAGDISLTAQGDIQTATVNASAGGDGGNITISSIHGNIATTGDLLSSSKNTSNPNSSYAGTGGAITLSAKGNINTQIIDSSSSAYYEIGAGGAIKLNAGANINTQNLNSSSYSYYELAGTGGAITLSAKENINTQIIDSSSFTNYGTGGTGGAITLDAGADINTQYITSSSRGEIAGTGGAIKLDAGANINTQSLYSSSSGFLTAGTGGAITLDAGANIYIESLESYSRTEVLSLFKNAGTGGAITLSAGDTINFQEYDSSTKTYELNSRGSINSSGATGSGDITINSNAPFVLNNGAILSDTFGSGKAGDIQIKATSISLTNGAQLSASSHYFGAGGNITLVASDTVELTGETTSTPEGIFNNVSSNIVGLSPGEYLGGYIPNGTFDISTDPAFPEFPSGTVFPSGVFSQTTVASTGKAGNLTIETGRLIINNGAAIATTTFGKDSLAGDISITARDSIKIDNGSILSGVALDAIGNSGKVELNTSSLELTNSGIVQTETLGDGVAGNIVVDADTVSISGKNSAFRATTATNSTGGDITVSANTLSVDKGGQILTSTSGTGDAGNITVNATQIQLSDLESGLLAQTTSAGKAGNLTIQPRGDVQNLRVFFQKGAQISASTSSSGAGGAITIQAPESITLTGDGSIISAETSGNGTGGDLTLTTRNLRVENDAKVSVNSTKSGSAGNLIVDANSIYLNNQGKISADTRGGGGNIQLKTPLLTLRRGSSITTNASGSQIPGGNINIDAKNGFIVAVPKENSDIRADSENFRGGNVTINNAAGIFGIQPRKQPSPQSDITATGATPDLSGRLQINTPDVDPSKGLVSLIVDVVDVARLVDDNVCARTANSSFIYTGHGGLPPSPNNTLNTDAGWEDWRVTVVPRETEEQKDRKTVRENNSSRPTQIMEAQGWIINKNGEVTLTSNALIATPHEIGSSSVRCQPPITK